MSLTSEWDCSWQWDVYDKPQPFGIGIRLSKNIKHKVQTLDNVAKILNFLNKSNFAPYATLN